MALSERSRSELYRRLAELIDEEAVGEMLSYFPARDVEEPVTKEFLRAELAAFRVDVSDRLAAIQGELNGQLAVLNFDLTARMTELRSDLEGQITELRTDLEDQIADLRTEVSELRGQLGGIRAAMWVNAGLLISFTALIVAMIRL